MSAAVSGLGGWPQVSTDVPLQIFKIGKVAIVGSSFELTTMAGRRLRKMLLITLTTLGVEDVGDLKTYHPGPEAFSCLEVQRQEPSGWVTVATDASPETTLRWERVGLSIAPESNTTVSYDLRDAEPGRYRLVHHGIAKETVVGLLPQHRPYTGTSGAFAVQ